MKTRSHVLIHFFFLFFFISIVSFFSFFCALVNDNIQEAPLASLKDKNEKWKPLGEIHADPFITPAKNACLKLFNLWNFSNGSWAISSIILATITQCCLPIIWYLCLNPTRSYQSHIMVKRTTPKNTVTPNSLRFTMLPSTAILISVQLGPDRLASTDFGSGL